MDLFGTKKLKQKLHAIEHAIKNSFTKVRQDMESMKAWVNHYQEKSAFLEEQLSHVHERHSRALDTMHRTADTLLEHSHRISELKRTLSTLNDDLSAMRYEAKKQPGEELSHHIENLKSEISTVQRKIESLSYLPEKMDVLKHDFEQHLAKPDSRIDEIQEKLKQLIFKKSPKEKLVQKVTKNSHDYIKAMILSYIKKYEKISAFQLREMVVEEQNITSKSTFYRIMEELEQHDELSVIWQGKEKIYLSKITKPL